MGEAVGEILPLAVGVAISPLPIIAAILMLLSPRARSTGTGFLLGWVVGIVAAATVFTLLAGVIPEHDPSQPQPVKGVVQLALGVLVLIVAVGQWRRRPRRGAEPPVPKWMQAIEKITFPLAAGLGFALAAINPKNLLMAVSAGVDIGTADLDAGATAVVIAVFTVIAASTVLVPVVGYLAASERLRAPLDALRGWLLRENSVIMAVLMLVIGVAVLGKGIESLS